MVGGGVFVNYRGEDTQSYGVLLYRELSREFGPDLVFLDSESIPAGADFAEQLLRRVRAAGVVLALIGRRWLEAAGPDGGRLIDDPADWVRRELAEAFAAGVRVVPVLADGARMPTEDELPVELAALRRCQYRRLRRHDAAADLGRLVAGLAELDPELALARRRGPYGEPEVACPYPGMEPFREGQARFFTGRDSLVATLLARVSVQIRRGCGTLIVIGPSGVGKSSLLRAGLLPALASGQLAGSVDWPALYLRPGADPVRALAAQLGRLGVAEDELPAMVRAEPAALRRVMRQALAGDGRAAGAVDGSGDAGRVVVVVDQLEELFTNGCSQADRSAMLRALLAASQGSPGHAAPALVVFGLRADFYDHCARISELVPHLQENQILVPPMTPNELRQAITAPADLVGLRIEPGLTELLVTEAGGQALPQLAYVLRQTFANRSGRTLTVAGYRATGGIAQAIATAAEAIHDSLTPAEQNQLRRLVLSLVAVVDGAEDTRRRVPRAELPGVGTAEAGNTGAGNGEVERILAELIDARLVTAEDDAYMLSHDALIRSWPRLQQWLNEARHELQLRQQLTAAARYWQETGHDQGALYRGARLARAREWAAETTDMTAAEAEFLTASQDAADATMRAEVRRTRQLRRLVAALATLLAVVPAVTAVAFRQAGAAHQRSADAAALRAAAQSRQLAAQSTAVRDADPRRAMLLAVASWTADHTAEARSALLSTQSLDYAGRLGDKSGGSSAAVSPDGETVAIARKSGGVELWDTRAHRRLPLTLPAGDATHGVYSVRFSPDGRLLATTTLAFEGGVLQVWELATGHLRYSLPGPLAGGTLAWGGNGNTVAVAFQHVVASSAAGYVSDGIIVRVADANTGRLARSIAVRPYLDGVLMQIAFSHAGDRIAMSDNGGTVKLLQVSDGQKIATLRGTGPVIALSSDGRTLVTGDSTGKISLWDARTGRRVGTFTDPPHEPDTIGALAFSPDGRRLFATGTRPWIRVWDTLTRKPLPVLSAGPEIADLDVSADGHTIVGTSTTGPISLWRPLAHSLPATPAAVVDVAYQPQTGTLAAASVDGTLQLLDPHSQAGPTIVHLPAPAHAAAYSPDGTLAVAEDDGTVRLLNRAGSIQTTLKLDDDRTPRAVTFSPNGQILVAIARKRILDPDAKLYIWKTHTLGRRTIQDVNGGGNIASQSDVPHIVFAPDSNTLIMTDMEKLGPGERDPQGQILMRDIRANAAVRGALFATAPLPALAISPDGNTIAAGGADRTIHTWSLAPNAQGRTFGPHPATISSVTFSPDGRTLATATTEDATIRLWDLATGELLAELTGQNGPSNALAFSPDGDTLAAAGQTGETRLWDTRPDQIETELCQVLSTDGSLTDEWHEVWSGIGAAPPPLPCS